MTYASIIQFAWRVLLLSLIASPVMAQENAKAFPAPLLPDAPATTVQSYDTQPVEEFSPAVCESRYWIVSSRCAVQNIHSRCLESWELDVFERTGCEPLIRSTLDALAAQINPDLPVCIFSHGSFVSWELQCKEAHAAFQHLQQCTHSPIQFIFFTWPSDGPFTYILPVDIGVRGNQAEFNGFHMAHLISRLPEQSKLSLIGHSHGSRVVLSAMHLAGGGTVQGNVFYGSMGCKRYRIVLAAAASDHNWLNPGQRYGCALNAAECLLNLRNQQDLPLAFYPLSRPLFTPSLGRRGFTVRDSMKLGWNAKKVRSVNVTCNLGREHLWPDYYNKRAVVSAILPYICF